MKKLFQIFCLSVLPITTFAHSHAEYTGLVGTLTHIKMCSENIAMSLLTDSNNSAELKRKVIEEYNKVRTLNDQLILQLSADCRTKKGLCQYKKLDKMLTCKSMAEIRKDFYNENHTYSSEKLEGYIWNLILLHKAHKSLLKLKEEGNNSSSFSFSGLSDKSNTQQAYNYRSINDISSCRERKVERILFMLDELRMCPVQKFIKKDKLIHKDQAQMVKYRKLKSHAHTRYCKCK